MQDAYIDPSWRSTDAARYFFDGYAMLLANACIHTTSVPAFLPLFLIGNYRLNGG